MFLIASGVALGWTLVNYCTVPFKDVRAQLARLTLALVGGFVVIVLLGATSYQAGLASAFVFLASALTSYAANARQVSKSNDMPFHARLVSPPPGEDREAVLLVSEGEPESYDGPEPWAHRFRRMEARGEATPHWFTRPFTYARIRAAYEAMGGKNPFNAGIADLSKTLGNWLGPCYVSRHAYLSTAPTLPASLIHLAEEGFGHIILVPLALDGDAQSTLQDQVTESRVRAAGVEIRNATSFKASDWLPVSHADRFRELTRGRPIESAGEVRPEMVEALRQCVITSSNC